MTKLGLAFLAVVIMTRAIVAYAEGESPDIEGAIQEEPVADKTRWVTLGIGLADVPSNAGARIRNRRKACASEIENFPVRNAVPKEDVTIAPRSGSRLGPSLCNQLQRLTRQEVGCSYAVSQVGQRGVT